MPNESKADVAEMTDAEVDALIDGAELPERIVPLCLKGKLAAEMEELKTEMLARAAEVKSDRLSGDPAFAALAERIDVLAEKMRAGTVKFRLRAMGDPEFKTTMVAHPPRDGVERDRTVGYNTHAVEMALVRRGLVYPVLDDARFDALMAKLTPNQFGQLVRAVDSITLDPVTVPFSPADLANSLGSVAR